MGGLAIVAPAAGPLIPALLVTLPAIGWLWSGADLANVAAGACSMLLFVAGMTDNVLKPLMLGCQIFTGWFVAGTDADEAPVVLAERERQPKQ